MLLAVIEKCWLTRNKCTAFTVAWLHTFQRSFKYKHDFFDSTFITRSSMIPELHANEYVHRHGHQGSTAHGRRIRAWPEEIKSS